MGVRFDSEVVGDWWPLSRLLGPQVPLAGASLLYRLPSHGLRIWPRTPLQLVVEDGCSLGCEGPTVTGLPCLGSPSFPSASQVVAVWREGVCALGIYPAHTEEASKNKTHGFCEKTGRCKVKREFVNRV